MVSVTVLLTSNCNLRCAHCCGSYGPGGKTMTKEKIDAVLRHLPKNTDKIKFSGGEVTTVMKTLEYAVDCIKNLRSSLFPKAQITIQTNGWWVKDQKSAYEHLCLFNNWEVEQLVFSGEDSLHAQAGLDISLIKLHEPSSALHLGYTQFLQEKGENALYIGMSWGVEKYFPIGRAKDLSPSNFVFHSCEIPMFFKGWPQQGNITIDHEGTVFLCEWQLSPSVGSALDSSVSTLIDRAFNDKKMGKLMRFGPAEYAKAVGKGNLLSGNPKLDNTGLTCLKRTNKIAEDFHPIEK